MSFDKPKKKIIPKFQWLQDERYQAVLKATRTIAFEFNPTTGEQCISPFINEFIAGNYGNRLLSVAMVEDNIIHPSDLEKTLNFRKQVYKGTATEISFRLLTPENIYHWFSMSICPFHEKDGLAYIGTITDIEKEVQSKEVLRYRAEYDVLTGIYNKHTFYAATKQWMQAEPHVQRCLVRFDIDRFKIINETYSLFVGDRLLCYIGEMLRELTNPPETFARINSDIFCLCLARSKEDTIALIQLMEQRLNCYPLDFQFILSSGIVILPEYRGEAINVLCDWAAMAERTVKGSYIDHYAIYRTSMSESLSKEHYLIKSMNKALLNKEFTVFLQPKYDMRNCSIIGAEALVRWMHPTDGMIPPGEFIPLFERNGFILRLDEYVWDLTCQTIVRWQSEGLTPPPISVNVSRMHLYDSDFCQKLITLVNKYNLPPNILELEITESAYTDNPDTLYGIMEKLQEFGFSFSMDDFGSGYSSLNILKDIPVDLIKIDLSFLQTARRGIDFGRGVLKGTIELINGINLPLIAEGVETAEQAEFLLNVGCNAAQGYYYAKPMPISDFEKLLKEGS